MNVVMQKKPSYPVGRILFIRGGLTTIVDPGLYDFLNQFKWFPLKSAHSVYVCTRKIINKKAITVRMHRLIMKAPSWLKVHHVNHNTFDNQIFNLMLMTEREHRHFDGWHIFYRN